MTKLCSVAAAVLVAAAASGASAQVIYEPVKSEHDAGRHSTYYYGGSDPTVHRFAQRAARVRELKDRRTSAFTARRDTFGTATPTVYLDDLPYENAAVYGATPADAQAEAYDRVPLHFRKRDLLNAAVPRRGGVWVVPADAQPVDPDAHRAPATGAATQPGPATAPQPILIIPKRMLDRKLSDKLVAATR